MSIFSKIMSAILGTKAAAPAGNPAGPIVVGGSAPAGSAGTAGSGSSPTAAPAQAVDVAAILDKAAAAKKAEKKAQRKKDSRVLTWLLVVAVLIAGGGVVTWLRVAPPSWLHHRAAAPAAPSARATASGRAVPKVLATPPSPVTKRRPLLITGSPRIA